MKASLLAAMLAGLLLLPSPLSANDSDASVSVGGIVLTREPRISMESERLTIALSRITVEYEFFNDSDRDITTEVAFPIPPYEFTEAAGGVRDFNDFKLWTDGQPRQYQTETKAIVRNHDDRGRKVGPARDVTAILKQYRIDIAALGHFDDQTGSPEFKKLPSEAKRNLIRAGAFDGELPLWEVHKTYHWQQTFPAHKVLHVRHEYSPAFGFQGMPFDTFGVATYVHRASVSDARLLRQSCASPELRKTIASRATAAYKADLSNGYLQSEWVDYILTTANSWKTPIKRFDLIVERGPKREMNGYYDDWDYASFCWDGPVKQINPHQFEASATNFIPTRDLKVLFLSLPAAH